MAMGCGWLHGQLRRLYERFQAFFRNFPKTAENFRGRSEDVSIPDKGKLGSQGEVIDIITLHSEHKIDILTCRDMIFPH